MTKLNDFINYLKKNNQKTITNLNSNGISFDIIKLCDVYLFNNFFNDIFINESYTFFLSYWPHKLELFINLLCCDIKLIDIYKMSDFGLAIQGCFQLYYMNQHKIYQSYDINNNENLVYINEFPLDTFSYLIIESHKKMKILNGQQMNKLRNNEKKYLKNIQFLSGLSLFINGKSFIDIDKMKTILMDNKEIDGKNVKINYKKLIISIFDENYSFNDINQKFKFKNPSFFNTDNSFMVFGFDINNDNFILYHEHIDIYNIILILSEFNCKDAILLCNESNLSILWKGMNENLYNTTDFIGNPDKNLSNIILFTK